MYYNIDNRCPEITEGNWDQCCNEGWRFMGNAPVNQTQKNNSYIQYLQYIHGITNVTLGAPFCDKAFKPRAERDRLSIGIYVRDVADMIRGLYDEIERWEAQ
jgi:hypothetical protein